MDHTKQTKIINTATGEVVFDKEEQMDFQLITTKGYLIHNNRPGVKVLHRLEWPITQLEKSKWMALLPYIDKNNALMRKDRPSHPLTIKLIGPIVGLSPNKMYVWMKRMIDTNMIRKVEGFFYVNPMYMMSSSRLNGQLYRIFEDQLSEHIPKKYQDQLKELKDE